MRVVSNDQTIPVFNVHWSAGLAQPHQGVWATLSLTTRGARLCIYDQAPDLPKRRCFAKHPFPLVEPVLPLANEFQKTATNCLQSFFNRSTVYSSMSSRLFG
jgi:hypothetical protein